MSKIQEALNKLRADDDDATSDKKGSVARSPEGQSSEPKFGQVVRGDQSPLFEIGGSIIEIDRQELRAAGYLVPTNQERLMADQYRLIKRPLLDNISGKSAHQSDDANIIMVTSALPSDGKTFTAINLAISISAEKDTAVLLADADVAKRHISKMFGVGDVVGLVDVVKDENLNITDALYQTDLEGVSILPAGSYDPNATELLASRRLQSVLSQLSTTIPNVVIVFDSPPLLATPEARVLAKYMGQILVVVRANQTPQGAVIAAIDTLDDSKAINLVLNQAAFSRRSEYYGEYGYYGHGYGETQ
jgi:exopolysaccharide/PEP-CTERM locus tyrosine autokinase